MKQIFLLQSNFVLEYGRRKRWLYLVSLGGAPFVIHHVDTVVSQCFLYRKSLVTFEVVAFWGQEVSRDTFHQNLFRGIANFKGIVPLTLW